MSQELLRDRVYIKDGDRDIYNRLLKRGSPFQGQHNKIPFLASMLIGYLEDVRIPLGKNRDGWILKSYLSEKESSIIKAIAVETKNDLHVLLDENEVYTIVEEYATGGLKLLHDEIYTSSNPASYPKRLELLLSKLISDIK